MVRRKCNFHIAFIDEHRELCVPSHASAEHREKYLLARAAIIRHLSHHLPISQPSIEVHTFTSIRHHAFVHYLSTAGVYFVLCHAGALPAKASEHAIAAVDSTVKTKRLVFRGMIWWFVTRGFNVALVDGLEWRDTKVEPRAAWHVIAC